MLLEGENQFRYARELEADGILSLKIFAEIPPRVLYSRTDLGQSLLPIIGSMRDWVEVHMGG